ncbi:MAG: hypothetical protein AAGH46_03510, partial [Bacteroidota bacterium]
IAKTDGERFECYKGHVIGHSISGYQWKEGTDLGSEIASRIEIRAKDTKLNKVQFYVNKNYSDSLLVRVKVYDFKNGFIGKNILQENVLHTIRTTKGKQSIDLTKTNLFVDNDVLLSIELVEVYGSDFFVEFSGINKENSFALDRSTSHDGWSRIGNLAIGFNVFASEPLENVSLAKREIPERLTIYWDRSLSAFDRDKERELALLDTYLRKLNKLDVAVIPFGMDVYDEVDFSLKSFKDVDLLIEYLRNLPNDGAVSFKNVLKNNENGSELAILFSDGNTIFEPLSQEISIPVFYINSSSEADHNLLKNSALYGDGDYLNLMEISNEEALNSMMAEFVSGIYYEDQVKGNLVKGRILINDEPIEGIDVRVKETYKNATTDEKGEFYIEADIDDILEVSYFNVNSDEFVVNSLDEELLINLKSKVQILEKVDLIVKAKERPKVRTAFGLMDDTNSPNVLRKEDFNKAALFLSDLIRGRFPQVFVVGPPGQESYIGRGRGSGRLSGSAGNVLFDVDGQIFRDPPNFIHPQQVESIRFMPMNQATIPYGTDAQNGVVIIQTISGSTAAGLGVESVLAKNNDYTQKLPLLKDRNRQSFYIQELKKNATFDEAVSRYHSFTERDAIKNTSFYLDCANFFYESNQLKSLEVLSNLAEVAKNDKDALKTLAYKLDEFGLYEKSIFVYEELIRQNPNDIQFYRDLALALKHDGQYSKSAEIYRNMLSGKYENIDFEGLSNVIITEFKHLLLNYRHKFEYQDLPVSLLNVNQNYDLRIVLEWTDPFVEFETQFVNPQNKFFKWNHTIEDNSNIILDEIRNGYHSKEFFVDGAETGRWLINIKCISERSQTEMTPVFLKYTVYKNYMKKDETKVERVISLYDLRDMITLDSFVVGTDSKIAQN